MTHAHSNAPSERFVFLDALRGVAALAVVIFHILIRLPKSVSWWGVEGFDLGHFGIVLFFLLSGFIIPVSIERLSLTQFWVRRLFRLYPLYWCALAIALFRPVSMTPPELTPAAIAANAMMLQQLFGYRDVLSVAWTLTIELVFYLLMSLGAIVGMLQRRVFLACCAISIAIVIEGVAPRLGFGVRYPDQGAIFSYLALIFTGNVCFGAMSRDVSRRKFALVLSAVVGMLLVTLPWSFASLISARLLALSIFVLVVWWRPQRVMQPLLVLGRISYSLYLVHMFVLVSVPPLTNVALRGLVWLMLSLVTAYLCERWIERPLQEFGRRFRPPHTAVPSAFFPSPRANG